MTDACGNFGAPPKPPWDASKDSRSLATAASSASTADRLWRRGEQRSAGQPLAQALAAGADLLALLAPGLGDRLQHLSPRGHALARLRREVGPAVERQLLGREETR